MIVRFALLHLLHRQQRHDRQRRGCSCKDLTNILKSTSILLHSHLVDQRCRLRFLRESISMAMKMTALTLVIRNSMSCIGFNISTNSCCHSFTSNRIATLLMQYLSPPCLRGPSLKTCPRCASQFPHRTSTLVIREMCQ